MAFDEQLRTMKDVALDPIVSALAKTGVAPTTVTVAGMIIGLAAAGAAAAGLWACALGLWIANRILDGVDGALARRCGRAGDVGGYVDLMADFVVYAAIPLGAAFGSHAAQAFEPMWRPAIWPAAALALAACYVNGASWMYLSAVLEKRRHSAGSAPGDRHATSVVMPRGIVEGTETIAFYTFVLLFPRFTAPTFLVFSLLVIATAVARAAWWIGRERRSETPHEDRPKRTEGA